MNPSKTPPRVPIHAAGFSLLGRGGVPRHEVVFGRLLERQISGLLATQNAIDIAGHATRGPATKFARNR
jgi:hypothetical protein